MYRIKFYLIKKNLRENKKYIFIFLLIFLLFLFGVWYFYNENLKKQAYFFNDFVDKKDFESCEKIISFNFPKNNKYIKLKKLEESKNDCIKKFSLSSINYSKSICNFILTSKKEVLKKYFLDLNNLVEIKKTCLEKNKDLLFNKKINKNLAYDFYYPKDIRFKDKIGIKIRFYNLGGLKNLVLKFGKNTEKIKLKKYITEKIIYFKNDKKNGFKELNLDFLAGNEEIGKEKLVFNISQDQKIYDTKKVYFGISKKLDDFIDFTFDLNDFNLDNTKVLVQFYNNDLLKIKDLYYSFNNGVSDEFYLFFRLKFLKKIYGLQDRDLYILGIKRKDLLTKIKNLEKDLKDIKITKNASFKEILNYSYYYVYLKQKYKNLDLMKKLKEKIYTFLQNKAVLENQKLDIYMILSEIDKKLDLRFIDYNKINDRHSLLAYTIALYNENKWANRSIVLKNIEKLKDLFTKDDKIYSFYYTKNLDKILFYNLLNKIKYKDKKYLDDLFLSFYKVDFFSRNVGFIEKYKYLKIFLENYLLYKKEYKKMTHFGFMIGNIRNKESFFIGYTGQRPFKEFEYNLKDLRVGNDNNIDFRAVKLKGRDLKINIIFREYLNNSKEIILLRKIYKKLKNGDFVKVNFDNIEKNKNYKIIDTIIFSNDDEKKDIVLKDFLSSNFEFIKFGNRKGSLKDDKILEYKIKSFKGKKLEISYFVKSKYLGEFNFPGFLIYSLSDNSFYGKKEDKKVISK